MPSPFSAKLAFVLKGLSISRGQLAADLGIDKSVVGRWVTGAVKPSDHNLARLTDLVAARVRGFSVLDWERDLSGLADVLGLDSAVLGGSSAPRFGDGLALALLDQALATTTQRGRAYEGFFRSTRPYAQAPGRFMHDHCIIQRQSNGLLRFDMGTGGVFVEGWVLTLGAQLFSVGAELTSGALAFGIFNGVSTLQAGTLDGLILTCALDSQRTPTASGVVFERIGDLSGDPQADQQRFLALAATNPVAPEGSVPAHLRDHLVRDIGPSQLASGGDWLLRLSAARSMSRGLIQ